jgi:hypothetical protein
MEIYRRTRRIGEVPLGAFMMLPLFVLPLGAWLVEHGHVDFGTCGMKAAFQMPCLSCGSTRATLQLLHGHPLEAISFQPMMMGIYAVFAVWGMVSLASYVRDERVVFELSDAEDLAFKISIVAIPILNWGYLYTQGI